MVKKVLKKKDDGGNVRRSKLGPGENIDTTYVWIKIQKPAVRGETFS